MIIFRHLVLSLQTVLCREPERLSDSEPLGVGNCDRALGARVGSRAEQRGKGEQGNLLCLQRGKRGTQTGN